VVFLDVDHCHSPLLLRDKGRQGNRENQEVNLSACVLADRREIKPASARRTGFKTGADIKCGI
jgi:hypothetical protein